MVNRVDSFGRDYQNKSCVCGLGQAKRPVVNLANKQAYRVDHTGRVRRVYEVHSAKYPSRHNPGHLRKSIKSINAKYEVKTQVEIVYMISR